MNTKLFSGKLSLFLVIAFLGFSLKPADAITPPDDLPSLKGKKILMVWGGWEGHEPKQFTFKLKEKLDEQGAAVTVSDSLGVYTNKELMSSVDLLFRHGPWDKFPMNRKKDCWKLLKAELDWPVFTADWAIRSGTIPNTSTWLVVSG